MTAKQWITMAVVAGLTAMSTVQAGPPADKGGPSGKASGLPYGLQKKLQRGGELPPGWKDKLAVGEPLDRNIFEQHGQILTPVNEHGVIEVQIQDETLRVLNNTLEIIDILSR